jgi:hypothetical protein
LSLSYLTHSNNKKKQQKIKIDTLHNNNHNSNTFCKKNNKNSKNSKSTVFKTKITTATHLAATLDKTLATKRPQQRKQH